jgi:hypothetical protein
MRARAYFLAHIACEELGKLPILAHLAVALKLGNAVDWKRVDRQLRSHDEKIKRVLFMDSIVTGGTMHEGREGYEEDASASACTQTRRTRASTRSRRVASSSPRRRRLIATSSTGFGGSRAAALRPSTRCMSV